MDKRTTVTPEELEAGFEDADGVLYSADGKKLLVCKKPDLTTYKVRIGTEIICDNAFDRTDDEGKSDCQLQHIEIPFTVQYVGNSAFYSC